MSQWRNRESTEIDTTHYWVEKKRVRISEKTPRFNIPALSNAVNKKIIYFYLFKGIQPILTILKTVVDKPPLPKTLLYVRVPLSKT